MVCWLCVLAGYTLARLTVFPSTVRVAVPRKYFPRAKVGFLCCLPIAKVFALLVASDPSRGLAVVRRTRKRVSRPIHSSPRCGDVVVRGLALVVPDAECDVGAERCPPIAKKRHSMPFSNDIRACHCLPSYPVELPVRAPACL